MGTCAERQVIFPESVLSSLLFQELELAAVSTVYTQAVVVRSKDKAVIVHSEDITSIICYASFSLSLTTPMVACWPRLHSHTVYLLGWHTALFCRADIIDACWAPLHAWA